MKNPFRLSDIPAENRTEVRLAEIREAEETARQRTSQREETKRARLNSAGYWWIRGGLLVVLALASLLTYCGYSDRLRVVAGDGGCRETAEVVTNAASARTCPVGGWYESRDLGGGNVLIRCHCGPKISPSASGSVSP